MNTNLSNEPFKNFKKSLENKHFSIAKEHLVLSFSINSKLTIRKLYEQNLLLNIDYLQFYLTIHELPSDFKILLKILYRNLNDIVFFEAKIKDASKLEVLQAVANNIEKVNSEKKHVQYIKEKEIESVGNFYETVRQSYTNSMVGIGFQKLLIRNFAKLKSNSNRKISIRELYETVAKLLYLYSTLDCIILTNERYLYFDWQLEIENTTTLKLIPGYDNLEGSNKCDIISNLKSKDIINHIDILAEKSQLSQYVKYFTGEIERGQYNIPEDVNERDRFFKDLILDIRADCLTSAKSELLKG
jgi:hypothetical protein